MKRLGPLEQALLMVGLMYLAGGLIVYVLLTLFPPPGAQ